MMLMCIPQLPDVVLHNQLLFLLLPCALSPYKVHGSTMLESKAMGTVA